MRIPVQQTSSPELRRPRLLHVGNLVVDLRAEVAAVPPAGGAVLAHHTRATPGGGFTLMVAAARRGLSVHYAGVHGSGPFSDLALTALRDAGISVALPPRPTDTGFVITLVDGGGEPTFVTSPAAVSGPTAEELAAVTPNPGDVVSVSGYALLDPASREALVPWVQGLPADIMVVLDPGPLAPVAEPEALAALLECADWCTATAGEATDITGATDPSRAAAALAEQTGRGVVVRIGLSGCVVVQPDSVPIVVAGVPVDVVDRTGAGGTHVGVFIAALASGSSALGAARTANIAAAYSATVRGPATAPTSAELSSFMAVHT